MDGMVNENKTAGRNILLIRFSSIGDVAICVPVVYSLSRAYPECGFTFLTSERFLPFFRNLPSNVNLLGVDIKKDYHGWGGLLRLYRMVSSGRFDAVADLHGVLRSFFLDMMFRLHGIPVSIIKKDRISRYRLTRFHFKDFSPRTTSLERYRKVLEQSGFTFNIEFSSIFAGEGGNLNLISPFTGDKVKPWIGVAPFAAHEGKVYPLELMEKVVSGIDSAVDCCQFIFAYGKEREIVEKWAKKYPSVKLIDTRLGLEGELVLISHLSVMLSMDSSNMHIASLTATPVVSVWGATHPYAGFLGYGQKSEDCIQIELDCRPCSIYGEKRCRYGDFRCMRGISPDFVKSKVLSYLSR